MKFIVKKAFSSKYKRGLRNVSRGGMPLYPMGVLEVFF
jgi:hypothetical protein